MADHRNPPSTIILPDCTSVVEEEDFSADLDEIWRLLQELRNRYPDIENTLTEKAEKELRSIGLESIGGMTLSGLPVRIIDDFKWSGASLEAPVIDEARLMSPFLSGSFQATGKLTEYGKSSIARFFKGPSKRRRLWRYWAPELRILAELYRDEGRVGLFYEWGRWRHTFKVPRDSWRGWVLLAGERRLNRRMGWK